MPVSFLCIIYALSFAFFISSGVGAPKTISLVPNESCSFLNSVLLEDIM